MYKGEAGSQQNYDRKLAERAVSTGEIHADEGRRQVCGRKVQKRSEEA